MAKKKVDTHTFVAPVKTIQVRVVDYPHGLRVFENIQMARIISEKYNLLLMADHVPVIGEVDGNIEIVNEKGIETLKDIRAFYMNRANVLSVLIKD